MLKIFLIVLGVLGVIATVLVVIFCLMVWGFARYSPHEIKGCLTEDHFESVKSLITRNGRLKDGSHALEWKGFNLVIQEEGSIGFRSQSSRALFFVRKEPWTFRGQTYPLKILSAYPWHNPNRDAHGENLFCELVDLIKNEKD